MVELYYVQDSVVLRTRSSELLILPQHVKALQTLAAKDAFAKYFTESALLNRPARKLFNSWARKEVNLLERVYEIVHQHADKEEE